MMYYIYIFVLYIRTSAIC